MILDKVNYPDDLKKLTIEEKVKLSGELRKKLIDTISKTGGHLASNLGVVELTIAIHSSFNTPIDKVIWDVGHQTYVHKIITGRKNKFDTLRQMGGMAGFPKTEESIYDNFNTGHSSTSISIALGMAHARDIKNENNKIIAVIGDGALTGGMALEALNDVGSSNTNMIVILNDNAMSISKNVGGIAMVLSKLRTKDLYVKANIKGKSFVSRIPIVGKKIVKGIQRGKRSIKQLIIPKMYFEDIGFRYIGPVDGHDIAKLEEIFDICKNLEGPILIHTITKKGKGYKPAEENPDKFHSASKFDIKTGEKVGGKKKDYSQVFGDKLVELAKDNNKIVAITAAMADGTGLKEFSKKFPKRFFDVGIAEQHAVGLAAGLAKAGMIPVVPIYSSFIQRAYDQLIHDVAIQNLPVVICADRAGIVGNDGETHQGLFDLAFTNIIPNFTIAAPKNFKELEMMLEFAIDLKKPILIRYPRGGESYHFVSNEKIEYGKCEVLKEGKDITIIAIGNMVARAMEVEERLEKQGIIANVINARFLKPFDSEKIMPYIVNSKKIITIEDGTAEGGLGTKVQECLCENNLSIDLFKFAYPDCFVKHGSPNEIEKKYGIDADTIIDVVLNTGNSTLAL